MSTSKSGQSVWLNNCIKAPVAFGPRHATGVLLSPVKCPIESTAIPYASKGTKFSLSIRGVLPALPSMVGILGP